MPLENYRYYCLDGTGHLHSAEWFSAQSDEEAIAQIRARHPDAKCEIWQGKRLVATLSARLRGLSGKHAGRRSLFSKCEPRSANGHNEPPHDLVGRLYLDLRAEELLPAHDFIGADL